MKHVFIIGSKGIPARYGGYETFVENLTSNLKDESIKYHVACISNCEGHFVHNDAECFNVKVPNLGPSKAVLYDIKALKKVIGFIKEKRITDSVVLILACRIGIVIKKYVNILHKLSCKVIVNPDGHEWKRSKWPWIIRKYWKFSEKKMIKYSDMIVCDSINIEKYIRKEYSSFKPNTCFIPYGFDEKKLNCDESASTWLKENHLSDRSFYLMVGRFVPENNFEMIINGFMASDSKKDLVIITDYKNSKFMKTISRKTHFYKDKRIKFVGTVYNQSLLFQIRSHAFCYLHGHSVGGTNPSLLEGLGSTGFSILYNVSFNREVAEDSALYFDSSSSLTGVINDAEALDDSIIALYVAKAKSRIKKYYSWSRVCDLYEKLFIQ